MAKTQYSLSDDQTKLGRPAGFTINVRDAYVSAGAGFVVALTGSIMTMPGLPKKPAAENIDVDKKRPYHRAVLMTAFQECCPGDASSGQHSLRKTSEAGQPMAGAGKIRRVHRDGREAGAMILKDWVKELDYELLRGSLEVQVEEVIYDSRKAAPGAVFVCMAGTRVDSHRFVPDVLKAGVRVILAEPGISVRN